MSLTDNISPWKERTQMCCRYYIEDTTEMQAIVSDMMRSSLVRKWNEQYPIASIKPTFRDAWKSHRCIVPASYYFEWEHLIGNNGKTKTGDKYAIQPQGSSMTWLCGLYRFENDMPFFVILTREPGEQIRFIHDRMPLILPEHMVNSWIDPDADPEKLIREAVTDLVAEKAE